LGSRQVVAAAQQPEQQEYEEFEEDEEFEEGEYEEGEFEQGRCADTARGQQQCRPELVAVAAMHNVQMLS
jgi:hypothetical protein